MTAAALGPIPFGTLEKAAVSWERLMESGNLGRFPPLARLLEHEERATRIDLLRGFGRWMRFQFRFTEIRSGLVGLWKGRKVDPNDVGKRRRDRRRVPVVGLSQKYTAAQLGIGVSTAKKYSSLARRAGLVAGPSRDGYNTIRQPIERCDVTPTTPNGVRGLPAIRRVTGLAFEIVEMAAEIAWIRAGRDDAEQAAREHARSMANATPAVQLAYAKIGARSLREAAGSAPPFVAAATPAGPAAPSPAERAAALASPEEWAAFMARRRPPDKPAGG